jgi:hypothetical protein
MAILVLLTATAQVECKEHLWALHLRVVLHDTETIVGEPVMLAALIRNIAGERLALQHFSGWGYGPEFSRTSVAISSARNDPQAWHPGFKLFHRMGEGTLGPLLRPGEEYRDRWTILGNSQGNFAFPDVGTYDLAVQAKISGHIKGRKGRSIREKKVSVKEPSMTVDKKLWAKLKKRTKDYISLVQSPWWPNWMSQKAKKRNGVFLRLARRHPKSTYSPYILFSVARHHQAIALNYSGADGGVEGQIEKNMKKDRDKVEYHAGQAKSLFKEARRATENEVLLKLITRESNVVSDMILKDR